MRIGGSAVGRIRALVPIVDDVVWAASCRICPWRKPLIPTRAIAEQQSTMHLFLAHPDDFARAVPELAEDLGLADPDRAEA